MINGINSGLQSALQSVQPQQKAENAEPEPQQPSPPAKSTSAAVNVSLQQTAAPSAAEKAMADYRALGQKAVLAGGESAETRAYEAQAEQEKFRQQAFLATAALKNNS